MSYESSIHGCHLYQIYRPAKVGTSLIYKRQPSNSCNRHTLAVLKDNVIVSHIPRQLPWILSFTNGTVDYIIITHLLQEALKILVNYFLVASAMKSANCLFPIKLHQSLINQACF